MRTTTYLEARNHTMRFLLPIHVIAPVMLLVTSPLAKADEAAASQLEHFEKKIRPVLVHECFRCHSADAKRLKGGLRLDGRALMLKGGDTGPAVVPGDPTASLIVKALRYEKLEMPPSKRLSARVIDDFEKWIRDGAVYPNSGKVVKTPRKIDVEAGKQFWSFQPPQRHSLPTVKDSAWPSRRIDWFVLSELERQGFQPATAADRRTWIRRATFDLIGLPPSPEEVAAFLNDTSPNAHAKVVARLLALPHYGERWARVWLDLARYAEDQAHIVGNNKALFYPNAYLYRDWVIQTLSRDVPYDEFVKLQLAADLMEPKRDTDQVALGFIGLGPKYYRRNALEVKADEWEDRVDVVSRGLLGLTVACARCHDHKYDPIPTEDYYALAGVFASSRMHNRPLKGDNGKGAKKPEDAMHVVAEGTPTDLNVFVRGNVENKGPVAKRHFPQVLCEGSPQPFTRGSGRLELAEAIIDRGNPLTARVIVNRVWGRYFGRALVATPSNFGFLGERPTHPRLLDDLAVRFMDNGWSLKWLQREIVLSSAYRQSSRADAKLLKADPDNRLLGRMTRKRLSVEAWRDALLSASGRLSSKVAGESIDPEDPNERRRTVYSYVSRLDLNPMLALFDFPDPNAHAGSRSQTTTPLQKMFVLNNPFIIRQAETLAQRLASEVEGDDESSEGARIELAHQLLYGRPPTSAETRLGLAYLQSGSRTLERWRQYAHVLLASNEMLFLD